MNPLWRKAPLLLIRFPALFVSIASSALLLGMAVSSGLLFVSSAASSVLHDELSGATRFGAGATVTYDGLPAVVDASEQRPIEHIERVDGVARTALRDVANVGAPVLTVLGATVTPAHDSSTASARPLRLLAKTDALAHVRKLAGREGNGFWIANTAAQSLGLKPGDSISLRSATAMATPVRVSIDGIYSALWKQPSTPYWRSLSALIYEGEPEVGPSPQAGPPPTFLIGSAKQVVELSTKLKLGSFTLRWEWPLDSTTLTQEEAERLAERFERLQREVPGWPRPVRVPVRFKGYPSTRTPHVEYSSFLPSALASAKETASTLRPPADLLSTAGALVAAAVVAAGAAFTVARRRTEIALLFARGATPSNVAARSTLESLVPITLGAVAGFVLALLLITALGPGPIDPAAVSRSGAAAALIVPLALLLVAVVVAVAFIKQTSPRRIGRRGLISVPWELAALALAGFFLVKLATQSAVVGEQAQEVTRPSLYLLLFPVAFIAGSAGLGARALRRVFRGLRRGERPVSPSGYLALRRLAAARALAVGFITAGALALGIFVYAQTVVASYGETIRDKSVLAVGSDVAGSVGPNAEAPERFPFPITKVTQLFGVVELQPGGDPIDSLAIDPATFPAAVHWAERYADRPLDELMRGLAERGPRLSIVVVGDVPAQADRLNIGATSIPVNVAARAHAFPGSSRSVPRVIVDRAQLDRLLDKVGERNPLEAPSAFNQFWVKGETTAVVRALAASSARPYPIFSAAELRRDPSISAFTRTFAFLKALAIAAAALAVIAALLYLQTRQRNRIVASALVRRMGLSARGHQLAVALELGGLLLCAFALAVVLALACAQLVLTRIEPLASLTPVPTFDAPADVLAGVFLALVAISFAGGWLTSRIAERARVAEVMRLDA